MRKVIYVTLFFLLFGFKIYPKPLNIYVDYAVFKKTERENIIEVYYGLIDTSLAYKKTGNKFVGNLSMKLQLFALDSIVDTYEWQVYYEKQNLEQNSENENLLVGQKNFVIASGENPKFVLSCIDNNDTIRRYHKTFDVENPKFEPDKFMVSDIEFAQQIESTDTVQTLWQREFLKGQYYIIPNPTKDIVGSSPRLDIYFEYYGIDEFLHKQISLEYRIYDAIQNEVYYNVKHINLKSKNQFDIMGFALDAMFSGMYFFEVKIVDSLGKVVATSKRKKFYLFNPDMPSEPIRAFSEAELFEKSIFAVMNDKTLDKEFEKAKYIASDYEKELYKAIQTIEGKRHFLFSFWRRRNPDSTLVFNQAYEDFNRKIEYANRFFSIGRQTEGWKTDRGRILIQYGEPTTREYYPREGPKRSYEIWFYGEVQGGAYFYFVDLVGNGSYVLVHSTAIGEVQNENWFSDFVTGTNAERIQKMFLNR